MAPKRRSRGGKDLSDKWLPWHCPLCKIHHRNQNSVASPDLHLCRAAKGVIGVWLSGVLWTCDPVTWDYAGVPGLILRVIQSLHNQRRASQHFANDGVLLESSAAGTGISSSSWFLIESSGILLSLVMSLCFNWRGSGIWDSCLWLMMKQKMDWQIWASSTVMVSKSVSLTHEMFS